MTTKRKTAKNWKDAHRDAQTKVVRVENQIKERALELAKANPDAPVGFGMQASKVEEASGFSLYHAIRINTDFYLQVIKKIEKYLADKHPHKQLEINMDSDMCVKSAAMVGRTDVEVVPAPPVGERVVVNGKTGEAFTRKPDDDVQDK